jgi:probable rRNA maturation factor
MPSSPFKLSIRADVGAALVPFLRQQLRKAHSMLPVALDDVSVVLVDDAVMSDLHVKFMNIPGATDVLTFPMDETSGEVVICVPEARRRGKDHGTALRDEVLLYAVHGMLHLCGLDDRTRRGFEKMHRMEDEILVRLGVGKVFHAHGNPSLQNAKTQSLKRPRRGKRK